MNKTDANDKFVAIAKAYRALTDEETRKNWEEFGDPDGRQPISYGIALPSWVVDPKFYGWVLGVYALIFGIMLPVAVGRWWRKSIKYTKDHVQNQSMALYFQEIKEAFNCRRVLELLSASAEFNDELKWRGTQDETSVGKLLRTVRLEVFSRTGEKLETPKRVLRFCQCLPTFSTMRRTVKRLWPSSMHIYSVCPLKTPRFSKTLNSSLQRAIIWYSRESCRLPVRIFGLVHR